MIERLKDARTWTIITTLANALMAYFKLDSQLIFIGNGVVGLIAFLLFGVEPVKSYFFRARNK